MIRIAKISLDIRKDAVVNNEPIILRQGESDVIIEATILNGGDETLQINFATFVAKKPDGTIVSNDPANVNGSVISYSVSKHLTESVGKIQDAYFVINNEVTTNGFDISVIPSTQLDGSSVNYIPGLENINKFLKSTEDDWLGRIQQMKAQIAGLDVPTEFKLLMDKALSDAKAQYQPIIDAAQENVESIAADLAAKKLDLQNNSDELNKTILDIKAQIAPVNSFLDNIQKQIIDANANFTADQQAKVSQSIADLKVQVSQSIADLKVQTDALVSGSAFKNLQTQVDNSAVGTNLYTDTKNFDNLASWSDPTWWTKTSDTYKGLAVIQTTADWSGPSQYIQVKKGDVLTYSAYARYTNGTGTSSIFWALDKSTEGSYSTSKTNPFTNTVTITDSWQRVSGTTVATSDGYLRPRIERTNSNTNTLQIAGIKVEKGSVATDYSLNPEDIATDGSVQTAITSALDKVDVGKTITATDDTGKTVNLKITGIS